jgi:DNA-binding GntR family transcriptional regulator
MPVYGQLPSLVMDDPRLSRRIHAALLERIADGTYPAGTRIHIGALADEFATTRTTVGKALKLLADEGRVQYYAGLGWYVSEVR